jgi:uncharacterized protein VirK/YbjX
MSLALNMKAVYASTREHAAAPHALLQTFARNARSALRVGAGLLAARRHRDLVQLINHPSTAAFAARHPKLAYKYLVTYAAQNLNTTQRHALLLSHYRALQTRLSARQCTAILDDRLPVWRSAPDDTPLAIHLSFPAAIQTEGDLCLTLKIGQLALYRIVFIVGDGDVFGLRTTPVLFITCIQGLASQLHIRAAKAACQDVHPADLLMAALDGVARALGIEAIVGIATDNQIANKGRFFFSYETFFEQYGALAHTHTQTMLIPAPLMHKQIALVASKHRKRSTAKRAFRSDVGAAVAAAIAAA